MEKITLQASEQAAVGGLEIPAELYGPGVTNRHLFVQSAVFNKILPKINQATLLDLPIDEQPAVAVLIREMQRDPLTDQVRHLDFLQVDPKRLVVVEVDLAPVGKSSAIATLGATLIKNRQSVRVECLPERLLPVIEVDLGKLVNVDDVIRIEDLPMPEGWTVKNQPREAVFSLMAARKNKLLKTETEAAAATPEKKEEKGKK